MAELYRFRGGPGSGKTTVLLRFIFDQIKEGTPFDDITMMTFSKSQEKDLKIRLQDEMPDISSEQINRRVATIDATTYRQCKYHGLFSPGNISILQPGDKYRDDLFQEFMDKYSLDFNPKVWLTDPDKHQRIADIPVGNQFINLNSHLTSTLKPHNLWQESASFLGLTISGDAYNIPDLLSAWKEYKVEKQVVEHGDYVRLALDHEVPPPSSILLIDEYQDVSPLQHKLLTHWFAHPDTKRVFVAGDEDQSIYGFRGCNPKFFLSLSAQDIGSDGEGSRPESHRCPPEIMVIAEKILGKQSNVSPHPERKGHFFHMKCPDSGDLIDLVEEGIKYMRKNKFDHMFILSRFGYNASKIATILATNGIPSRAINGSRKEVWGELPINGLKINLYELKCVINKYLTPRSEVSYDEALAFLQALGGIDKCEYHEIITELTDLDKATAIRSENLHKITDGRKDDILDRLNLNQKITERIRACLRRDAQRGFAIHPDMIRIDTIHAAKGLESPITLLHSGYLKNRCSDLGIPERKAEERRIYFTGATRTSNYLVIVDYGKSPVCPLLEEVI